MVHFIVFWQVTCCGILPTYQSKHRCCFLQPELWLLGPQGGLRKKSRLTIARRVLQPLTNYVIIRPLPKMVRTVMTLSCYGTLEIVCVLLLLLL